MKIAVIGPGAMGLLYGGKLSAVADVTLIGNNEAHIDEIKKNGVTVERNGVSEHFSPEAVMSGKMQGYADLVILFTKAYLTQDALKQNRDIIGPDTILLTLQNGAGHEKILRSFADDDHILIGTTAQGSTRKNAHTVINSGLGDTVIGTLKNDDNDVGDGSGKNESGPNDRISEIVEIFKKAGFPAETGTNIRQIVWNKLMINASSSVLSGVLQKPQGFVVTNESAWAICKDLIREICDTAAGEGLSFDVQEQINRLETHLKNAPDGLTSIYSDLKNGRKTEVDYINGAVTEAAKRQEKSVPTHTMIVRLVHAMEER